MTILYGTSNCNIAKPLQSFFSLSSSISCAFQTTSAVIADLFYLSIIVIRGENGKCREILKEAVFSKLHNVDGKETYFNQKEILF